MSYIVIARKYRPQIFDGVIGQEHITDTLKNAIQTNRVAHAYLFTGPRGVGKTTTARILAKTLNCEKDFPEAPCNQCNSCREITGGISMNVIEIDGASNRGIDHIRDLRENIKYTPSSGKYKIYIIDEVHMLTTEAFNALLKTVEEPPAHAKFFMATTEIHKVPQTILSRCQRFDFRLLPPALIVDQMADIARQEGIKIDRESLMILARYSGGSMRDAQSFFDQLSVYGSGKDITAPLVREFLGIVSNESLFNLLDAIADSDIRKGLDTINGIIERGHNTAQFIDDLIQIVRALMLFKTGAQENITDYGETDRTLLGERSENFSLEQILYMSNILMHDRQELRNTFSERVFLEMLFVKLAKTRDIVCVSELISKGADNSAPAPARAPQQAKKAAAPRPAPVSRPPAAVAPAPEPKPKPQTPASGPGRLISEAPKREEAAPAAAPKKESPAPAPPAAGADGQWDRLINKLKKQKPLLASFLSEGAPALDGDTLVVTFSAQHEFNVEKLSEAKNAEFMAEALKESGYPAKSIKYTVTKDEAPTDKAASKQNGILPGFNTEEIAKHPRISRVLDTTGGEVVKVTQNKKDS